MSDVNSEDNQSVISSSGSEEYLPKLNEFLDVESDCSTTDEMNFIGQHPTNLQTPMMPVTMVQPIPRGVGQFSLAPPPIGMSAQDSHETNEDILEFMSKQSKIIGSNMMEELTSPTAPSAENVYKPGSETELTTATTSGDHDTVPTVYLGQEVLTKHSTLQSNGVMYVIYDYRWVCKWQHISLTILASNNRPPMIPYKDLAYKVLADIAARALSAKISKLGYELVSLPEEHVQLLQQHDVIFKKNYKCMYLVDFVRLCKLYDVKIPESLEDLYALNASHTMEDIQSGKVASLTSDLYQNQQAARMEQSMNVELNHGISNNVSTPAGYMPANPATYQPSIYHHHGQEYFYSPESCSFAHISNNLVHMGTVSSAIPVTGGQEIPVGSVAGPSSMPTMRLTHMPQASFDGRVSRSATNSPMKSTTLETLQISQGITDLKYDARNFVTADGQQITLIIRDDGCYLCANNITTILPQFNRSFLEKKRGMRYVNANRLEIELLKQRGLVAKKACRAALYSAKTIVDICYSSSVQPPSFIVDFACEKYPEEKVSIENIKAVMEHIRVNQQRVGKTDDTVEASPEHKRSSSEKVLPEDNSLGNDVRLCSLPWGSVELHLLQPQEGEPYISISEISNKLLNIDAKRCQQRRQRMQIHSIHATVQQMQLLRSSGALKGAYCKLIRITDAVKLCQSFGLGIPDNVKEECQPYEEAAIKHELSSSDVMSNLTRSASLNDINSQEEDSIVDPTTMTDGIDSSGSQSGLGSFQRIKWDREGTKEIVIYTSTEGVHYCGLHELYTKVLQNTVERFTLKTRMRKLGVRSMRAPPLVRIKLIELHSLPNHSPVCALILLSEAESLVRSFHLPVPHVVYETFLKNPFSAPSTSSGVDSLIVSIPRRTTTTELSMPSFPGKLFINPVTMPTAMKPTGSALHSMARKISRKNHKIAQQRQQGLFSHRRCPSCGHFTPSLKKRCQKCQSFLVGRACPACNELNHNRSVFCNKCHTSLYPDKSGVNVKLGTVQVISSSVQGSTYYPMSQPAILSQAPAAVITQAQTTVSSQGPSSSVTGDTATSPLSPRLQFSAPPMRAAALKTLFPSDTGGDGSSKQPSMDTDASKKLSAGTHYRSCPECSQPNPRSAKKCQNCQKPLQGKACPQCGRPNHSWVPSCYKCGSSLPSYLGKTGKRNTGARHIPTFYNNYVIVDKEESTVPVNACVRCYDVKLSGSFKCGRCGCSFKTKPVSDKSTLPIEASSSSQLDPLEGVYLVDFSAENLNLSSTELTERLNETLAKCKEELHKVEEISKGITEEYEATHNKRLRNNVSLHDQQAELDSLVDHSVSLQHSLKDSQEKMEQCQQIVTFYPEKIKTLEEKIQLIKRL